MKLDAEILAAGKFLIFDLCVTEFQILELECYPLFTYASPDRLLLLSGSHYHPTAFSACIE